MNLLYISPQFPQNFIQFVLKLKKYGVNALGVASDDWHALPEELRGSLAEYYRVDDMNNYSQVLAAGLHFRGVHGPIDRVESHTEYWLTAEAALREDLNVWGKGKAETALIRHKSLMKAKFRSAGLPVAEGEVVLTEKAAWDFVARVGYPVIMKPDAGVGAHATYRVDNDRQLKEFIKRGRTEPYFIEEFIDGQIETFDGITNRDGEIVYCNSLRYGSGIMEVVNADEHVYYHTSREIPSDLEEIGRAVAKLFDVREKFFHLEFFRRASDGLLMPLEVNIRPPGGFTVDMWNFADDIDLYDAWAKLVATNQFDTKWSRKYYVAYVGRKDRFPYKLDSREIERRLDGHLVFSERLSTLFRNALGDSGYIVRAETLSDLHEMIAIIHDR